MIDKFAVEIVVDRFNAALDKVENSESFDESISILKNSRESIAYLEQIINKMKQEEHDITQDVYNKFKNKGYSKRIRFY